MPPDVLLTGDRYIYKIIVHPARSGWTVSPLNLTAFQRKRKINSTDISASFKNLTGA
jgi:hypothetical protein